VVINIPQLTSIDEHFRVCQYLKEVPCTSIQDMVDKFEGTSFMFFKAI
jgi:hypothetical protein